MKKNPDITQTGLMALLERISRSHPFFYLISRNLAFRFNIFEKEFEALRFIDFKKKKINFIDIGASDGIAIKYINKIINLNYVYAFEPNIYYVKKLNKLKKNFNNLKIFNFGLNNKKLKLKLYIPKINFFFKNFYMFTYAFYNKDELKENLKVNFILKKNFLIDEFFFKTKKYTNFKKKIDLIKIDVNGNEMNVIKGLYNLIKRDKPILIVEELNDISKIKKLLGKIGYDCYIYNLKKKLITKNFKSSKPLNFFFINKKYEFKKNK